MSRNGVVSLVEAVEHCRQITRARARNFYYGLKLTPEPKRSALYVIYAWMRQADDLVDQVGTDLDQPALVERVTQFRAATDAALDGDPVDDNPIWISLHDVVNRFELPRRHFHDMIEGQLDDLRIRNFCKSQGEIHSNSKIAARQLAPTAGCKWLVSPAAATISGEGVSPAAKAAASGLPPGSAAATIPADVRAFVRFPFQALQNDPLDRRVHVVDKV